MGDKRQYRLTGATLVTPTEIVPSADLEISGRRIVGRRSVGRRSTCGQTTSLGQLPGTYSLDLHDYLVFPGLINAHDHLNGTWWPRVAPGRPYTNVYQWLDDLHTSPVRYDRQRNSVEDIYELGMYRNLIAGVTTVADHFWRIDGPEFYTRFPIEVLYKYGRTWTPREPTGWGKDISTEYGLAVRTRQPYIIHLAEGTDQETSQEMDVLLEANALGRNTMIVHGIALRPEDMRAMARVGASVCWCPSSNLYLYEQTANIPALLDAGINITLGTDSSLSGDLNLLQELRIARSTLNHDLFADAHHQERWLVESVTTRAAYALHQEHRSGRIAPGYDADLLVLPNTGHDPYSTLIQADVHDIALLCRAGTPVYGDPAFYALFEQFTPQFTPVLVSPTPRDADQRIPSRMLHPADTVHPGRMQTIGRMKHPAEKLIAGNPLELLDRLSQAIGRTIELPFLPLAAPIHTPHDADTVHPKGRLA